jgi:hypothetical protein
MIEEEEVEVNNNDFDFVVDPTVPPATSNNRQEDLVIIDDFKPLP